MQNLKIFDNFLKQVYIYIYINLMNMEKTDYQIAAVNALKAVDGQKQAQELTDEQRWDMWYEAELKELAMAIFDMEEEDFRENNKYTPLNNVIR